MEALWKLSFATSAVAAVVVAYLGCCILTRLRRWFVVLRMGSDRAANFEGVSEAQQPALAAARQKQIKTMAEQHALARSMVVHYLLCTSVAMGMCMRCLAYLLLLALGGAAGQRGCNLVIQLITLLSGVQMVYVYVLFWRRQRYLYFGFGWKPKWLSTVSWSAVALMTVASMIRLTMEIATWRYGPQYLITERGCVATEYSPAFNVAWIEWRLPNLYKVTANSLIALCVLSLYAGLCVKRLCNPTPPVAEGVKRPNNQPEGEAATDASSEEAIPAEHLLGRTLRRVTVCAVVAFVVPVIVPVVWLELLPPNVPAILALQVDDCGLILQAIAMMVSIDDWKETFRLRKIKI